MFNQLRYLNNSGSKFKSLDPKEMKCRLVHKAENYNKVRTIEYFENFGNFVACVLKYKGKRISCLPSTVDANQLHVLYVNYLERDDNDNF